MAAFYARSVPSRHEASPSSSQASSYSYRSPSSGSFYVDDTMRALDNMSLVYQGERHPNYPRGSHQRSSFAQPPSPIRTSDDAPPAFPSDLVLPTRSAPSITKTARARSSKTKKSVRFSAQLVVEHETPTYYASPEKAMFYPGGASYRLFHPEELPCPILDELPRSDAATKHLRSCMLLSSELGVSMKWGLMPSTRYTMCELYPNEMLILKEKTKMKTEEQVALTGVSIEVLSPVSMSLRIAHTQKEMVRLSVREGQEVVLQEWFWMLHIAMAMKVDVGDMTASLKKKKESKTRSIWVVRAPAMDEPGYLPRVTHHIASALAGAEIQVLHSGDTESKALAESINECVNGKPLRESVLLGRSVFDHDHYYSRAARRKLAYDIFVARGRIKRLLLVVEDELLPTMIARAQRFRANDQGLGMGYTPSMLKVCNGVEFAVDMKTGDATIVSCFA
ncbi:hypothetical protein SPRG_02710 [Saprolegnia parasitica CBS 223.65]|uniref:Uncharacterized protein n=1 Tax=Saprolegnia parasitica (strain CBS 223.65) TaxID=695850 RepID=A0A067CZM8_SAPPC|nr:hypothetical protein SPRG_02710 [Saprolegnia parasitica CBS 223.65]KDO32232.1 hypothetical protein SPRG_02710 [Saprolegnia parasitica CBS 223.65]|eukprot:XP_012196690.1 hypothetical protein SPRG_02710 [Saprolegnia parasitica CBS 223.65]